MHFDQWLSTVSTQYKNSQGHQQILGLITHKSISINTIHFYNNLKYL